jgi:sporulation protein YabP
MDAVSKNEQPKENKARPHKLVINDKENLSITGISRVYNANKTIISLQVNDTNLVIEGADMQVTKLDVNAGNLEATGKMNSVKYTNSSQKSAKNLFSRVFK